MRVREITPETYAREVLPLTAPLWAGRRSFGLYAEQTIEIARSAYGRRHYATFGLYDGNTRVASFKRYERSVHDGTSRLPAIGFGAVFTKPEFRGRGYASIMLASELDRARAQGFELAYLFSDIRPQFYVPLGFRELPSRDLTLRADALPPARMHPTQVQSDDWAALRRCFEACESRREAGFARTAPVWGWIRMRARHGSENATGHGYNLVVRRKRGIRAYVLGARQPERDTYFVDEFGFADDASAALIPALLRAAAGDLRRIAGWVPPHEFRDLLPKARTHKRSRSILMLAPLRSAGERLVDRVATSKSGGFCWATDHI